MLSESSYHAAIYTYLGSASVLLIYLAWILSRYWRAAWVSLAVLLCAALLFTPAYPDPELTTMAPALVVAVFEGLINGPESAQHAIKPLVYMTGLALIVALVLGLTLFRGRRAT